MIETGIDRSCSPAGKTLILGHRGSPLEAPQNTLPSFLRAMEQGADGVELDVHLTADGSIAVAHNYTLQKTTNGRGLLAKRSLSELKLLDAGSTFSEEFVGTPIPTLQEVIGALDRKAFIMIEIKSYLGAANRRIALAVAGVVRAHDLYERAVVSSFNPLILALVKEADPRVPTGWLHHLPLPGFPGGGGFALSGRPDVLHPFHRSVGRKYMAGARRRGCRVIPWTVNGAADLRRMLDLGADGVITDRPGMIREMMSAATEGRQTE